MAGGKFDQQPDESLEQWRNRLDEVDVNRLGGNFGAIFLTRARSQVKKMLAARPAPEPSEQPPASPSVPAPVETIPPTESAVLLPVEPTPTRKPKKAREKKE